MTTVYVATFFQFGREDLEVHTVGVFRSINRAFHALHNFVLFRHPHFFSNMSNFPLNELLHFGEDFNENENQDPLVTQFLNRFIIPFVDSRFRNEWNVSITKSTIN